MRTLAGNGTKGSDYKGGEKGSVQARQKATSYIYLKLSFTTVHKLDVSFIFYRMLCASPSWMCLFC